MSNNPTDQNISKSTILKQLILINFKEEHTDWHTSSTKHNEFSATIFLYKTTIFETSRNPYTPIKILSKLMNLAYYLLSSSPKNHSPKQLIFLIIDILLIYQYYQSTGNNNLEIGTPDILKKIQIKILALCQQLQISYFQSNECSLFMIDERKLMGSIVGKVLKEYRHLLEEIEKYGSINQSIINILSEKYQNDLKSKQSVGVKLGSSQQCMDDDGQAERINSYLQKISENTIQIQSQKSLGDKAYNLFGDMYKMNEEIVRIEETDLRNQKKLENHICGVLNKGGGYIYCGLSCGQNDQHMQVIGIKLSVHEKDLLKTHIKKCIEYINPKMGKNALIHFVPIFQKFLHGEQFDPLKQEVTHFIVRIWLSVQNKKILYYCADEGGKLYDFYTLSKGKIQYISKKQMYSCLLKHHKNKKSNEISLVPSQPLAYIFQQKSTENKIKIGNSFSDQFSSYCSLKFPCSQQQRIINTLNKVLQKNQIKYSLYRPHLKKVSSQKIAYWTLSHNSKYQIIHKMIKDMNNNQQISSAHITRFVQFEKKVISQNGYSQFIQLLEKEYCVNQLNTQSAEIGVYYSQWNLTEKFLLPKHKSINNIGKCQPQNYNYIIWQFPSIITAIIFQGILYFTNLLRITYLFEKQYKYSVSKDFLIKGTSIVLSHP